MYESVLQYERRLQEEKEKLGAMRALLEAAEEDTDDHIQKKGKKMTATTTMNGNKKSFCNTDVVNEIITTSTLQMVMLKRSINLREDRILVASKNLPRMLWIIFYRTLRRAKEWRTSRRS